MSTSTAASSPVSQSRRAQASECRHLLSEACEHLLLPACSKLLCMWAQKAACCTFCMQLPHIAVCRSILLQCWALQKLYLYENRLTAISGLAGLNQLTHLYLQARLLKHTLSNWITVPPASA